MALLVERNFELLLSICVLHVGSKRADWRFALEIANIDHRLDNVEGSPTPPTHLTNSAGLPSFDRNGTVLQRVSVQLWLDRTPS